MTKKRSSTALGYGYRWQQARASYLSRHPLCVDCERHGRLSSASVVDHIIPHKGNMALFWDRSNWQSLCTTCHNKHKKRLEMSGRETGCDIDGMPIGAAHHWNKKD